jgi:hypothetical protein
MIRGDQEARGLGWRDTVPAATTKYIVCRAWKALLQAFVKVSPVNDPENPGPHPERLAWITPDTSQRTDQGFVAPEIGTAPGRPCRCGSSSPHPACLC